MRREPFFGLPKPLFVLKELICFGTASGGCSRCSKGPARSSWRYVNPSRSRTYVQSLLELQKAQVNLIPFLYYLAPAFQLSSYLAIWAIWTIWLSSYPAIPALSELSSYLCHLGEPAIGESWGDSSLEPERNVNFGL